MLKLDRRSHQLGSTCHLSEHNQPNQTLSISQHIENLFHQSENVILANTRTLMVVIYTI